MRLLCKHVLRATRRAPLQPILVCLTVMLAVVLSVTAFSLADYFGDHAAMSKKAQTELGDLVITARTDSEAHLLFVEQAEAVLAERAEVMGDFSLSAVLVGEASTPWRISAVDLEKCDTFYRFSYLSYGSFTTQNHASALVISARMAAAHQLSVGDSVTLRLLDTELTYTVQAIAEKSGLLAESDALISFSGLVQLLADRAPIIASLGDTFAPCTRLMVRVQDDTDVDAVQQLLLASAAFADKSVVKTDQTVQNDFLLLIQITLVAVFLLLLLLLAIFVIATALALLHQRRAAEYALFALVGAMPKQITLLMYAESLLYAFCGTLPGILLAVPTIGAVGTLYPTHQATPVLGVGAVLFGAGVAPLLMLACTAVCRYRSRGSAREGSESVPRAVRVPRRTILLATVLLAVCVLLLYTLPVAYRFAVAVVGMLSVIWLVFLLTPLLQHALAHLLQKISLWRGTHAPLWLAAKNVKNGHMLRYTGKLLAVFLSLLLPLTACRQVITDQISVMTEELPFDFIVVNAPQSVQNEVEAAPAVAGSMQFTYIMGVGMPKGATAMAASFTGDVALCLPPSLQPSHVPVGREIMISRGLATRCGVGVGDTVPLVMGGVSHDFVVSEILRVNANFLYFDATSVGMSHDMLCVRLQDGSSAAAGNLTATLEANGAFLLPPDEIFGTVPVTLHGHVALMRYMLALGALLSALGCINVFLQQHRARRGEREILCCCGADRKTMLATHALELALIVLAALLLATVASAATCYLIDRGASAFGMALFV